MKKEYIYIKELLDKRIDINEISKSTGVSKKEIEEFYNGEYEYIKTEENMKELAEYFGGGPVIRSTIYDPYDPADKPKNR